MFVKKFVLKGVASGVGAASEALAERKERRDSRGSRSPSPSPLAATRSYDYDTKDKSYEYDTKEVSSDSEDEVELAWELDEAAAQLAGPPPAYEDVTTEDPDQLANSFMRRHTAVSLAPPVAYKPLANPVILPQRRPKNKTRGFVRAYAPALSDAAGIDQQMWLDFLEDFDKASKTSPIFDVINLACFAAGFAGGPIATGVTIAVQVANNTAKEVQGRYRRNHFLDQMNESLFKPRGLFCMIMTFKPDAAPVIGMDVTSTDQALAKVVSEPDSDLRRRLMKLRLTSGTTRGEMSLPDAAPLIYPAIDDAANNPSEEKQNFLKASGAFMNTYLDRRAHAIYASTNSNSQLVAPDSQRQFKSKYADPNHPIHSGTVLGLITAGKFDPIASKRARKARRRAQRQGVVLTEEEVKNAEMGRKMDPARGGRRQGAGPIGLVLKPVKKAIAPNLLYLTVVNLPSESEMMEIRQELERTKSASP